MSAPRWLSEHQAKFAELAEVRVPNAGAMTDDDNEFHSDMTYCRALLTDISFHVYTSRQPAPEWDMELSLRMIEMENTHQVIKNLVAEWQCGSW